MNGVGRGSRGPGAVDSPSSPRAAGSLPPLQHSPKDLADSSEQVEAPSAALAGARHPLTTPPPPQTLSSLVDSCVCANPDCFCNHGDNSLRLLSLPQLGVLHAGGSPGGEPGVGRAKSENEAKLLLITPHPHPRKQVRSSPSGRGASPGVRLRPERTPASHTILLDFTGTLPGARRKGAWPGF